VLIDGFTIVAQIVNFLILVALLRRFLYGPIVKAMSEREASIASRLEEAGRKKQEAEREAAAYQEQKQALEEAREHMLHEAKKEAEAWRKELMKQAREEVDEAQARWQRAIGQEQEAFLRDLRERAGHQTYAIARRALADLANSDLERRIVEVFIRRIGELDGEMRTAIAEAGRRAGQPLLVRSAFEIPPELREQIASAVNAQIAGRQAVAFETTPDLIGGIELKAQGYKVAWSLAGYLESLEEELGEALKVHGQ
jgi:F-type H+-transporting ATPase subunit b